MNDKRLLVGVLAVLILALGGVLLVTLGSDGDGGEGAVVSGGQSGEGGLEVPDPAAARVVTFEDPSPREKWRDEQVQEALRRIDRIKKIGKKVGDFYMVEENGVETFYFGDLAKGIGRYGQPLYATVKGRRVPVKERRQLRGKQVPNSMIKRLDGPMTQLPGVTQVEGLNKLPDLETPTLDGQGGGKGGGKSGVGSDPDG